MDAFGLGSVRRLVGLTPQAKVGLVFLPNIPLGEANCVAFSSGFGDATYPTVAGFDVNGEITTLVTDFIVFPLEEQQVG